MFLDSQLKPFVACIDPTRRKTFADSAVVSKGNLVQDLKPVVLTTPPRPATNNFLTESEISNPFEVQTIVGNRMQPANTSATQEALNLQVPPQEFEKRLFVASPHEITQTHTPNDG